MSAVYFAKVGNFVKIGFASNPTHRAKTLLASGSRLLVPDDLDRTLPVELILVVPFCRMRDERNMQLLFARFWTGVGEWFNYTPEFDHQMRTMRFVTHAARAKHLRKVRRELGIVLTSPAKEEHFGMTTAERLADRAPMGGAA